MEFCARCEVIIMPELKYFRKEGGKLNRRVMQSSSTILLDLLPSMISIMIDHGIEEEWGTISFPPVE